MSPDVDCKPFNVMFMDKIDPGLFQFFGQKLNSKWYNLETRENSLQNPNIWILQNTAGQILFVNDINVLTWPADWNPNV